MLSPWFIMPDTSIVLNYRHSQKRQIANIWVQAKWSYDLATFHSQTASPIFLSPNFCFQLFYFWSMLNSCKALQLSPAFNTLGYHADLSIFLPLSQNIRLNALSSSSCWTDSNRTQCRLRWMKLKWNWLLKRMGCWGCLQAFQHCSFWMCFIRSPVRKLCKCGVTQSYLLKPVMCL